MLKKIISGGQTGADEAGLAWALARGLRTGGWMTRTWKTDEGTKPHFESLYGMKATSSVEYPVRTRKNVEEANATIIIGDLTSKGTKLTIKLCIWNNKPYILAPWQPKQLLWPDYQIKRVAQLMMLYPVINIAGNRERLNPGIYKATWGLLELAYYQAKERTKSEKI